MLPIVIIVFAAIVVVAVRLGKAVRQKLEAESDAVRGKLVEALTAREASEAKRAALEIALGRAQAQLDAARAALDNAHKTLPPELRKGIGIATFALRECLKITALETSDVVKIGRVRLTAESALMQLGPLEAKHGLNQVVGESDAPSL